MEIYNNLNNRNLVGSNLSKNELANINTINPDELPNINKINNNDNNTTDSIEISEKNSNVINTKKAYDAFRDANSEKFGDMISGDMSGQYIIMQAFMKKDGIEVPDFTPDNATAFLPFLDKMKEYTKNLMTDPTFEQHGAMPLTNDFLDFCDSFKEKLIQYDCK